MRRRAKRGTLPRAIPGYDGAQPYQEQETRATSEQREERATELERVVFFSDAVFAIAITLLVIDIKVPEIHEGDVATELPRLVRELLPNILSYVISFLIIATQWLAHRRISPTSDVTIAACSGATSTS